MPRSKQITYATLSCVLLTFGLVASAKADTIENLVFTGTATCEGPACNSFPSGSVTGTYSLDVTTQMIVGAWSFTTPFGVYSSSSDDTVVSRLGDIGAFFSVSDGPLLWQVNLFYPGTDTLQIGALANDGNSYTTYTLGPILGNYPVTGTTALASISTPEPAILSLLCLGMLGLVGLRLKNALS